MLNKLSKTLILGYVMLFLSLFVLDQSTKRHSEKNFFVRQRTDQINDYQAGATRLLTLGDAPFYADPLQGVLKKETINLKKQSWFYINLTYLRNQGAIWGILSNANPTLRSWILNIVAVIAFFVLFGTFRDYWTRTAHTGTMFILAGAVGNIIDRLRLGYVIDWVHPHWKIAGWEYSFPVFNLADVFIDVGFVLILSHLLLEKLSQKKESVSLIKNEPS
jgi:signal peptidase II